MTAQQQGYPVYQDRLYKIVAEGVVCIRCGELLPAGEDETSTAARTAHREQCEVVPLTELTILLELERLIPPLTEEEYKALETSLKTEGCRDALVVWGDVLVDGHNRYRLCKLHHIPFQTIEREFSDLDEVKLWMIRNQLARRNLTMSQRATFGMQLETLIAAKAKANQGTRTDIRQNSDESFTPISTKHEVSEAVGMSHDTYHKAKTVLTVAPEPLKTAYAQEIISTNAAYEITKALQGKPQRVIDVAMQVARDNAEKVEILARLFASNDKPYSNATFDEIANSGGFHYGDELELWCNFAEARVQDVQKALASLADHHRKLEMEARREARVQNIQQQATPLESIPQKFPVLYADPPWRYDHPISDTRRIENHYPTMDIDAICALPIEKMATEDAILFLWATTPMLEKAFRVMRAWGFDYRTSIVWDKQRVGMGYWVRQQHEFMLIGVRGNMLTPEPANRPASVIRIERPDTHSEKPHEFRLMIERMYPELPRIELFARVASPRWHVWGNEVTYEHPQSI